MIFILIQFDNEKYNYNNYIFIIRLYLILIKNKTSKIYDF
jgi:hypothetical protein